MRRPYLVPLFLLLALVSWAGETCELTILHTNDLHGWMRPFDFLAANAQFVAAEGGKPDARFAAADAGGLARRATMVAGLRKEIDHPVMLIDAGDISTRGPWHGRVGADPIVAAYNAIGYDMICVGNNDLKLLPGVEAQGAMLTLMRQCRFPWLAANLTVGDTGVPVEGVHPFIVRRIGEVRVGFLGLTAPRAATYPQTKGLTVANPIEAAKKWVPLARKECDILIAVTHIGSDSDKVLAAKVEGIDAIVGGDSHTFLPTPLSVANPKGVQVPIAQAGAYGVRLGRFDLTFEKADDGWHLVKSAGALLPVDAKTAEDPAITRVLDMWLAPAAPAKVGYLPQWPALARAA
jgi:2',3'-cyclic-nucleotide 2'-phosphodiesterase (5'-nucleotidase family)